MKKYKSTRVKVYKSLGFLAFLLLYFCTLVHSASAQTCVQADLTHPDSAAMTWIDNSTDETGFVLERKQDSGAYSVLVAALAANLTAYTDSSVVRGTAPVTYTYRIKAVRTEADKSVTSSAYSAEACITFAALPATLPAPAGLTLATISSSSFRITWEDMTNEIGYELDGKQARGSDTFTQIASLAANVATFDWTGRKRYTPYCVRLRGLLGANNPATAWTQSACATTSK